MLGLDLNLDKQVAIPQETNADILKYNISKPLLTLELSLYWTCIKHLKYIILVVYEFEHLDIANRNMHKHVLLQSRAISC